MASTREEVGTRGGGEVIDNTKTRGYGWFAGLCVSGLLVTYGVWLVVVDAPTYRFVIRLFEDEPLDRKSTRLNSRHRQISYAGFCLEKKKYETSTIPLSMSLT